MNSSDGDGIRERAFSYTSNKIVNWNTLKNFLFNFFEAILIINQNLNTYSLGPSMIVFCGSYFKLLPI